MSFSFDELSADQLADLKRRNPKHISYQPIEMIFPKWFDNRSVELFCAKHNLTILKRKMVGRPGRMFQYKVTVEQ